MSLSPPLDFNRAPTEPGGAARQMSASQVTALWYYQSSSALDWKSMILTRSPSRPSVASVSADGSAIARSR